MLLIDDLLNIGTGDNLPPIPPKDPDDKEEK